VSDRPASSVEVRRAGERFHTATPGVESWHSFSFGAHYDPTNLGFGALLAHNDETLAPGAGFDPHPHRDVEIVTYVVSGSLTYSDDAGRTGVARPGLVQLVRAGSGIVHAERNASATEPVRFIQLWVAPDVRGIEPTYQLTEIKPGDRVGWLVPLVAGLSLARFASGESIDLPAARFVHVFVVSGAVWAERAGDLATADALRITGCEGSRVTAIESSLLLIWRT
jgi:uncharacterized RmlC-like cupin family protein